MRFSAYDSTQLHRGMERAKRVTAHRASRRR